MERKKTRVCLYSLGCKVNGYETERMTEEFREAGYQIAPPFEAADVYIINTCTVTNIADRKSRKMLRHAAKANPDAVVVAAGCYVDAEKQFGVRDEDDRAADLWVANKEKKNIVAIVEGYLESRGTVARETDNEPEMTDSKSSPKASGQPEMGSGSLLAEAGEKETKNGQQTVNSQFPEAGEKEIKWEPQAADVPGNKKGSPAEGHTRAYLKIQDGCNQFCSYCIIPFARGRVVSRKPEEVLAEAGQLSAAGYREIVLTGIHISSYGLDFKKAENFMEPEEKSPEKKNFLGFEEKLPEKKDFPESAGKSPEEEDFPESAGKSPEEEDYLESAGKSLEEEGFLESAGKPSGEDDPVNSAAKSPEEEVNCGKKNYDLIDLIREICTVPGIDRVRLGSMEPRIITEENIRILAESKKVCPHFHLSLQSGCDATLRRMNRHYTTAEYLEKCEIIRRYFPDAAITTDVIVGFPGETEEEFEITKAFLAKVRFARMHIFKYSARRGTRAAAMENQIPEAVKDARSAVLRKLNLELEEAYARSFLGGTEEVLFEENAAVKWVGHTAQYLKVGVETDKDLRNQILPVRLTEAYIDGGEVRMRGEV